MNAGVNAALAKYNRRVDAIGSMVCVGLDPELERLPARFGGSIAAFNRWVIEQTAAFAAAYKPNMGFYEARGARGWEELAETAQALREICPEALTICDAKRGDNAHTNRGYVKAIFDELGFDAVTLHAYLGSEALAPFLERDDKVSILLCRTSNLGAGELQDLMCEGEPLWMHVARKVSNEWDRNGNCMLVVGATYPEEMRRVRAAASHITFLVPGVGAQGGDVQAVVEAGLDAEGRGLIVSSSRAILFAEHPRKAACDLRDEIEHAREATLAAR